MRIVNQIVLIVPIVVCSLLSFNRGKTHGEKMAKEIKSVVLFYDTEEKLYTCLNFIENIPFNPDSIFLIQTETISFTKEITVPDLKTNLIFTSMH